jgi:phosphoribosylanthranilate isomerase
VTGKLKLKVCGMRDPKNILEVGALMPDYMGFIFYPASPRYVGKEFTISPDLPPFVKRVGVFVNHPIQEVISIHQRFLLDYVQLHGDEPIEYGHELKSHGIKLIKVFRVSDEFDFTTTEGFESVADYFLFDTKGKYYGGNATRFNWDVLNRYNQAVPFFLSGGISPELILPVNVHSWNIHAIDVNSGVERHSGMKDISKIKQIIKHIAS